MFSDIVAVHLGKVSSQINEPGWEKGRWDGGLRKSDTFHYTGSKLSDM